MKRSRGVLVLGTVLVAGLALLVNERAAPRGGSAETLTSFPGFHTEPQPERLAEPGEWSEGERVEAALPAAAPARELAASPPATDGPDGSAPGRVLGKVSAAPELGLDAEHPLDSTRILWTVFPGAQDEGRVVRQLEFVDERGRFTLEDVPAGCALELEVLPPVGPEQVVALAPLLSGESRALEIVLDPGAEVHGCVRSEAGEPMAGVLVRLDELRSTDLRVLEYDELDRGILATTGLDGRFEFAGLPRSTWTLALAGVPAPPPALALDTTEGSVAGLQVTVAPAPVLEIVTRTADGTPVDSTLHYSPKEGTLERLAPGRFRLSGPPRRFRSVSAFGHVDGQFFGAQAHDVHAGVSPFELVLSPERAVEIEGSTFVRYQPRDLPAERYRIPRGTSTLVGRIVDARGGPLDDVLVSVSLAGGERTSRTNLRGEFLLPDLTAGTAEVVLESMASGALLRARVELEPDERSCLEFHFEAPDPAHAEVRFLAHGEPRAGHLRLEGERGRLRRWIDGSGRARLELPYPGRYSGRFLPADELEPLRVELDVPTHVELEFRVEDLARADVPR